MMAEMAAHAAWTPRGSSAPTCAHWVLHSAGRRVLDRARVSCSTWTSRALAPARGVLRDYGNMSSATILFVLERVLQQAAPDPGEWGVMIGLGPGFAAEGALLRW